MSPAPRCPSPTGSSGRCSACCRPPGACPSPASTNGSPACSPATTCPTRRSSAPASRAIAAWPARPIGCVTSDDLLRRSQEHSELIARAGQPRPPARPAGLDLEPRAGPPARPAQPGGLARRLRVPLRAAPRRQGPRPRWIDQVDVTWHFRARLTMLFEVEWTAMLGEPLLRRGGQIPPDPDLVRFLVDRARADRADPLQARALAAPALRPRGRQLAHPQGQPPARLRRARPAEVRRPRAVPRARSVDRTRSPASRRPCSAAEHRPARDPVG